MARRFLPGLRRSGHPAERAAELKVVLGDYYGALASAGVWNSTRSRPWPVERAVAEGYERIIWVYRSVEAISGQACRLPFRLKQGEDVVDDHPLMWLLNHQANPMETGRQFRKRLGAQCLLSKRGAFVQVTTARNGTPARLDLLPPGRTRPVPGAPVPEGQEERLIDHYEIVRADGTRGTIPAEQVIWFRDPHPLDPYSGTTPLEAAGMSAELDFFARLYNVQFLKNDARPGGILGINGDIDDDEMERIEAKFGRGPAEAGKLTVIAGDVSYVDSVVRPRDMQYSVLAGNSKNEILTAFGVPESILGFCAAETYANAAQEHLNFWQITMPPHMDLQVTGFDSLSEPELEGFFDVSKVDALQAAEAAKRAEKREEFAAGLIILDEYREAVGMEALAVPASRCLYVPNTSVPVPTTAADQKALGGPFIAIGPAAGAGAPDGGNGGGDGSGSPSGSGSGGNSGQPEDDDGGDGDGESKAFPAAPSPAVLPRGRRRGGHLRLISSCQVKAIPVRPGADDHGKESAPDAAAHAQLEAHLNTALTALTRRWTERTVVRLGSPKTRKGTRHWQPDTHYTKDQRAGNQAFDASQAVGGDRWQDEAQTAVAAILQAAAAAAAAGLTHQLVASPDAELAGHAMDAAHEAAGPVITMVGNAASGLAAKITGIVSDADQSGAPMDEIAAQAKQAMGHETGIWAPSVATQAATATVNSARDSAAQAITDHDPDVSIMRVWKTRHDDKVRPTHAGTAGQTQPLGSPFIVGDSLLRYPGDPLGPPNEVYNCRCHLNHRSVQSGRFVPTPFGQLTRAPVA